MSSPKIFVTYLLTPELQERIKKETPKIVPPGTENAESIYLETFLRVHLGMPLDGVREY